MERIETAGQRAGRRSADASRRGRTGPSNPLLTEAREAAQDDARSEGAGREPSGDTASNAPSETSSPHPTCNVAMCPICTLVTAFGEARPELTEHLLVAGRELLLALKVLIDARLGEEEPPEDDGLTRIAVD